MDPPRRSQPQGDALRTWARPRAWRDSGTRSCLTPGSRELGRGQALSLPPAAPQSSPTPPLRPQAGWPSVGPAPSRLPGAGPLGCSLLGAAWAWWLVHGAGPAVLTSTVLSLSPSMWGTHFVRCTKVQEDVLHPHKHVLLALQLGSIGPSWVAALELSVQGAPCEPRGEVSCWTP